MVDRRAAGGRVGAPPTMPPDPQPLSSLPAPTPLPWTLLVLLALTVVVHAAFAVGVLMHSRGRRTELVPRAVWVLAVACTGLFGAVGYWLVHRPMASAGAAARR